MFLEEKAWFSEDYRFATITNGYLSKEKFGIVLESCFVKNDKVITVLENPRMMEQGDKDNIFNLTEKQKNERIVQKYDVCDVYKGEVIPKAEVCFSIIVSYLCRTSPCLNRSISRILL